MRKVIENQRRRPYTLPCSAAKTPNWQVTDESTRMIVNTSAYGRSRCVGGCGHPTVDRARAVKYMANSPAKNISSLESQTIVPTLTMFGRVRECTREGSKVLLATGAVVTGSSWHRHRVPTTSGAMRGRHRDLPETVPPPAAGKPQERALGSRA